MHEAIHPGPKSASAVLEEKRKEEEALVWAREFMSRPEKIDQRIKHLLRLRSQLQHLDPTVCPPEKDSARRVAERLKNLEAEIDREVDQLYAVKSEIWAVLERLENLNVSLILDDLYLSGYSMEKAARHAGYTKRYTQKLCRFGLLEVARLIRKVRLVK